MTAFDSPWRASYRRSFERNGQRIEIRRGRGTSAESLSVRARVKGYEPSDLVGDIQQGDRKVIILAEDVTLDPPFNDTDVLVVNGQPLRIKAIDNNTRRKAGVLLAFVVRARGH